jgi:hypothetical protein
MPHPLLYKYRREALLLSVITALTIFTHFGSLYFTPPWYSDEGWTTALILNLMNGKPQVFCFTYIGIPHAPLSYYLAIPFFYLISDPMVALRTFTALIGVLTTFAVYFLGREVKDPSLGFLSALLFSVFYPEVIYHHMGFIDYNLAALLLCISATAYLRFLKNPHCRLNEYLLVTSLALAFITHYYAVIFGIAIFFTTVILCRKLSLTVFFDLCLSALPVLALFIGLYATMGDTFLSHFNFNFLRASNYGLTHYGWNLVYYLLSNWWNLAAFISIIALVLKTRGHLRLLFTSFLITILITFQFVYVAPNGSYAVSYTYPMLIVSLAYALYHAFQYMVRRSYGVLYLRPERNIDFFRLFRGVGYIILMTVISLSFVSSAYNTLNESYNGFNNPYPAHLNQCRDGMEAISSWVNTHTTPEDLVIGSPHYLFMLHCKASDYSYAIAFNGGSFYRPPASLNDIDVIYSGKYTDAKYCIIDPFVTEWFALQPGSDFLLDITTNWSLVDTLSSDCYNYTIYLNPSYLNT